MLTAPPIYPSNRYWEKQSVDRIPKIFPKFLEIVPAVNNFWGTEL